MFAIILLYFFFAISLTLTKLGLPYVQPIFFQGVRLITSGLFLLSYSYFFQSHTLRFDKKHAGLFFQIIFFLIYINAIFWILSLDDLSLARNSFLINLTPFITALFSYFYFAEILSSKKLLGMVIGFIGFAPLLFAGNNLDSASFLSIPGLQAIGSTVAFAFGWILVRQLVDKEQYFPIVVNGIIMSIGGVAILLTSLVVEPWSPSPIFHVGAFIAYLFGVVLFNDLLAYNLYGFLLRRYTPTLISFTGLIYPLFSALLGWFFFAEGITWNFFLSMSIVIVGLYIFYIEELAEKV